MSTAATPAPPRPPRAAPTGPPRVGRWALLAFAGALAVYAWGAAPTVLDRDSGELQAVALTGGVAHTTGYPSYALVGWAFTRLVPGDPAWRVNVMSSFFGAVSLALLVVVGAELSLAPAVAFAGAILYGAGFSFWAGALRAEVYTLSVALFLLAWWRTQVALRTDRPRDRVVAAVLLGLTLTGHLASAPAVAVLGLSLAWRAWRLGRAWSEWPLLVLGLGVGLLPYLHIPLADQRDVPMNYLRLADHVLFPETGVPTGAFASPAHRLWWLVTGMNDAPGSPAHLRLWGSVRTMFWSTPPLVLFETGPLAAALAIPGFLAFRRERRDDAMRLALLVAASYLFSIAIVSGPLLPLFLLFALAPVSLLAARGLQRVLPSAAVASRPWLLPLAACGVMAVPHALRLWSYAHPIGPRRWTVLDEDSSRPFRLLRRLDRPYAARDFGLGVLRAAPPGALVLGEWRELAVLFYYCRGLGRRPDLTLQPLAEPSCWTVVRRWQAEHDPASEPVLFLSMTPALRARLVRADSIEVAPGQWVHRADGPLDEPAAEGRTP